MSFLPVMNRKGCLAGIYLVNTVVAPLPVLYAVGSPCNTICLISLTRALVDSSKLQRHNKAGLCCRRRQRFLLHWQHNWPTDFSGSRCTQLPSC